MMSMPDEPSNLTDIDLMSADDRNARRRGQVRSLSGARIIAADNLTTEDEFDTFSDWSLGRRVIEEPQASPAPLEQAQLPEDEWIEATITRPFDLTLANGRTVHFPEGTYDVPESLANHWYFRANGAYVGTPEDLPEPEIEPAASGIRRR